MMKQVSPSSPILVIDDEESILLSIDTILQMAGLSNVITCSDSRQALSLAGQCSPSVVLLDLNMPHLNGEAVIEKLTADHPRIPIIIITGRIDAETAVDCLQSGAADYIVKPVEEERLLAAVRKALKSSRVNTSSGEPEMNYLRKQLQRPEVFAPIITQCPRMFEIFEYIESISRSGQPVLIRGNTGTGKELIARAIHDQSERQGTFVAVNVAGVDDNVFSDTLFGHVKGAFTGADTERPGLLERAEHGTLFLDEIGDLPPASQVKLLRLLQEHEYMPLGQDTARTSSARIIASTHVDLWDMQRKGLFRKDLHYRLRTHRIQMPPLNERKEDLPILLEHFITAAASDLRKKRPVIPNELITLLENYSFPGNVRELQAMVFDAVAQNKHTTLSLTTFREHMARAREHKEEPRLQGTLPGAPFAFVDPLPSIKEATEMLINEAMSRADNNQSIAASLLGISQQALSKRLKKNPPDKE